MSDNHLPLSLQSDFINGLIELQDEPVDVVLASHAHNYNILGRYSMDDGSGDAFLDASGWKDMLQEMLIKSKAIL